MDAKRALFDFCADHNDQHMALIEAHGNADDLLELRENVCRLYEVGKRREADECDDEQVHFLCITMKDKIINFFMNLYFPYISTCSRNIQLNFIGWLRYRVACSYLLVLVKSLEMLIRIV